MGSSTLRDADPERKRDRAVREHVDDHDRSRRHHHSSSSRHEDRHRDRDRHEDKDRRRTGEKDKERSSSSRHHQSSSKSHRHRDDEADERDRKRHRSDASDRRRDHRDSERDTPRSRSKSRERSSRHHDVSKADVDGEDAASMIPTSASSVLKSSVAPEGQPQPPSTADPHATLPKDAPSATQLARDDWMLGGSGSSTGLEALPSTADNHPHAGPPDTSGKGKEDDFFTTIGKGREKSERQRLKEEEKAKHDPEKLKISSRELNTQFAQGKTLDEYYDPEQSGSREGATKQPQHGAPGWQWRMMKLRRVFETAQAEGRDVEELALERYGSAEAFEEAKAERAWLDMQGTNKKGRDAGGSKQERKSQGSGVTYMFSDNSNPNSLSGSPLLQPGSRPLSRQSFRKPGQRDSTPPTPSSLVPGQGAATAAMNSSNQASTPGAGRTANSSKSSTPIPSVFTPTLPRKASSLASDAIKQAVQHSTERDQDAGPSDGRAPLDQSALNKLQAKVMRADMMKAANAAELRKEFEAESKRAEEAARRNQAHGGDSGDGYFGTNALGAVVDAGEENETEVHVLPTLDGRGQLYDVGRGVPGDEAERLERLAGNRRKKKGKFETRDATTGELLRYNADDDEMTLGDMVREERFSAGSSQQKNVDVELASRIARDGTFKNNLDYIDDNVERLARKNMKSDALKRQFAIQDFARTKKALDTCQYCWQEEGAKPPRASVIASGTRAYLALPERESLVQDHCLIVPVQHHLSSLELDDDCWDEIKNFMKCLMQMAAKKNRGVIFFETITSFKNQRHTYMECLSLPWDMYQDAPAYFKEGILASESEWSQHAKVIDFAKKGFRGSMISKLPYFMVQFDYKGFKGYGHVIEGQDTTEQGDNGEIDGMNEVGLGGQEFSRWFAQEIVGNLLDLEPRRWRKPRRLDEHANAQRLLKFKAAWEEFDWTKLLDQQ